MNINKAKWCLLITKKDFVNSFDECILNYMHVIRSDWIFNVRYFSLYNVRRKGLKSSQLRNLNQKICKSALRYMLIIF